MTERMRYRWSDRVWFTVGWLIVIAGAVRVFTRLSPEGPGSLLDGILVFAVGTVILLVTDNIARKRANR